MAFPVAPATARKLLPGGSATARTVAAAGGALGFDLDGAGDLLSGLWQLVKAKAAELVAYLATLLSALAKRADEVFPPEARSETLRRWVHVAVTVALPAVLGALLLYCVARCVWRCCCCCCVRRAARRGMMVAPGRGGARMPRDAFEDDPRRYFRDLRARKPLVY